MYTGDGERDPDQPEQDLRLGIAEGLRIKNSLSMKSEEEVKFFFFFFFFSMFT